MAPEFDKVRAYWEEKGKSAVETPAATMKDIVLRGLETESVAARLHATDEVLDVGCGDGRGAVAWAGRCRHVVALDYADSMVRAASEIARGCANVEIARGDVLDLGAFAGMFDAVVCIRTLINLSPESDQRRAFGQLIGTLRPGGRLLLIEGFRDAFDALNDLRARCCLSKIELNWHNLLLDRGVMTRNWAFECGVKLEETADFGLYYFLSRIVYPLAVAPVEPEFASPFNRAAAEVWRRLDARNLVSAQPIGPLLLHVFRKAP